MKIHARNRKKCEWYPYQNRYYISYGWMHFVYSDGMVDHLAKVPKEYAGRIKEHFLKNEKIIYTNGYKTFYDTVEENMLE